MSRSIHPLLFAGFLAMLFLVNACKSDTEKPSSPTTPEVQEPKATKTYKVPRFHRDSAYAYVETQVNFGPRVPETEGHRKTREWLTEKMQGFGLEVIEQNFDANVYTGESLKATNIIAQYNPAAEKRILLAAHWDTRPFADSPLSEERRDEPILGADDAGSGVGVLVEIARQLSENPINPQDLGVDIIFFDAEDYGESGGSERTWCLGSQHWSTNLHKPGYSPKYGILLDMVGAANPRFTKDRVSMEFAPNLMNKVWNLAQRMGFTQKFVNIPTGVIIDDHYFVNTLSGIPMINIINKPAGSVTGFGEHWHTQNDDMGIIEKETLRAVGQVVLAVIYREASGSF